jgi:DNA-binding CsgD family transcriptional regulator/tetratricopeptide (TPR) repeat protein
MAVLFDRGEYTKAAALYDDVFTVATAPVEATLLRARVHMRQNGEVPKSIALLNRIRKSTSGPMQVRQRMLLGESYASTGDFASADRQLDAAFKSASASNDKELIADVAFRLGRRFALFDVQTAKARTYLPFVRGANTIDSRLNALHLESWILSREGRTRDQVRVLMQLLEVTDPQSPSRMEHRLRATQTLAALARETFLPDAVPIVERQLTGVPWPAHFAVAMFQTTKAVAWAKALQGDYFNAFRYLRRSAMAAPDAAWRTMALCDRAYLAQTRRQDLWFRQELSDAEEAAEAADWEACADEAVLALLMLAELLAPVDAAKASEYLARFRDTAPIRNSRSLLKNDPRFQAMVEYSTGIVDVHLDDRRLGVSRIKSALAIFETAGFEWRAGRAALRLYDFSRKPAFLERAEHFLRNYGNSWLGEDVARLLKETRGHSTGLTPMQDTVFRLICQGMSNAEIGEALGISPMTVANHAKAVLKTFAVSSRHALIAEAIRRGVI